MAKIKVHSMPEAPQERKEYPLFRGLFAYFPDALLEVSRCSYVANEQHNPGEPIHWAREKSTDQEDCLLRHVMGLGTVDSDGLRHAAKAAWRALAILQLELEASRNGIEAPANIPAKRVRRGSR